MFVDSAEKILNSSSIVIESVDFWLENKKYRLVFSHTRCHASDFHSLSEEERKNVVLVSEKSM